MKNSKLLIKLVAAILVIALTSVLFAGCNTSKTVVMSFTTEDGSETYEITEDEFSLFMKIQKRLFFYSYFNNLISYDSPSFWSADSGKDGKTNEVYYKELAMDKIKAFLIEEYLFEANGLEISSETLSNFKKQIKTDETNYGGKGAYKQYFGYKASDYGNVYMPAIQRSSMLLETLTKEGALLEVKDTDLETYYKDHYIGYQYIVIDLNNEVVRDEETGDRVVKKNKDDKGNEVDGDTYETKKLEGEAKEKKQNLAQSILDQLKEGASFEEMIEKYSDEYYSVEYPEGWFLDKELQFLNNKTVDDAAKKLEIGESTGEVIKSGNYHYIVKRVDLKEKVYEDTEENEYAEFFEGFEEVVEYDNYDNYVKGFFDSIQINEEIIKKYTMANTFLNKESALYRDWFYSSYGYFYIA
ncbi:MAG: peptidylprolyl isomerase [Clostridia bacterium]|nr:peptidylprolyl isomerase [Clostridia bacterium]